MKAIRIHAFGGPEMMKLEDLPDPQPGSGQVLIANKAIGVNPVDTYIRAGKYGPKDFPYTPGSDSAGVVEAVGPNVTKYKKGDRVYVYRAATGAYAEKCVADEANVHPLPENITFQQGAALGVPYGTAFRALHIRAQTWPGETVLIHGATGAVGLAALQMAREVGCTIIATGGSDRGRVLLLEQGAHHALDHHDASMIEKVMDITAGRGVDVILEMLANVNLGNDLKMLAKKGRCVVIGSRGTVEIDPRMTMAKDADIRGMSLSNASPEELKSIYAGVTAGLECGTLRPIIDHELPLSKAPESHVEVLEGNSHGKIVLIP